MDSFTALTSDPNLVFFLAVIGVAGIVRGFSGFGAGMIIAPIGAALYSPLIAIITLSLLDFGPSTVLLPGARSKMNLREVLPVAFGYVLALPAGFYLLTASDPQMLRWLLSLIILAVVVVLWRGWTYRGPRTPPASLLVGASGGVLGGSVGVGGPPPIIYWMAARTGAGHVRANLIALFAITQFATLIGLIVAGLFSWRAASIGIAGIPAYFAGLLIGIGLFGRASDVLYRRIALALVLIAAITTAPIFDTLTGRASAQADSRSMTDSSMSSLE